MRAQRDQVFVGLTQEGQVPLYGEGRLRTTSCVLSLCGWREQEARLSGTPLASASETTPAETTAAMLPAIAGAQPSDAAHITASKIGTTTATVAVAATVADVVGAQETATKAAQMTAGTGLIVEPPADGAMDAEPGR